MAAFRWPEDRERLDWDILQHSPVCLYLSRDVLARHVAWLEQHGYLVRALDCAACPGEEAKKTASCRAVPRSETVFGLVVALNRNRVPLDVDRLSTLRG